MIDANSLLRNLPAALDRKQAVFLDGIRHSAEIASLAYERLKRALTEVARKEARPEAQEFTGIFLDAWAIVDAIDRFQALWKLQPYAENLPKRDVIKDFGSIRNLRNVADHLAGRMDYVISRKGTALGSLKWLTWIEDSRFLGCIILPGTFQSSKVDFQYPVGKTIELPTGFITLSAGEHEVVLGEALSSVESYVRIIERLLAHELDKNNLHDKSAGSDFIFKAIIDFGGNIASVEKSE